MTALTTSVPTRGAIDRILSVTRLHFVNKSVAIYSPLLIMAGIWLVNVLIWWIILTAVPTAEDHADAVEGFSYSGASLFIFVYMLAVAVQAINLTFQFAQGYSVTRRDFYVGSSAAFVLLSAFYAVILTVLSYLEEATGGWGLGGRMFTAVYFSDGPWYERLFVYFGGFLFFFFIGAATASVYVRWRTNGMLIFFAALTFLLVGAAALVTFTESWGVVGEWFVVNGRAGVVAWSLVPTALAAIAGYRILQRATPRN